MKVSRLIEYVEKGRVNNNDRFIIKPQNIEIKYVIDYKSGRSFLLQQQAKLLL